MNKKNFFITLLVGLLVVLAFSLFPSNDKSVLAQATGSDGEMRGFAWSSNIGWISFNSADLPNSSVTYRVNINPDNTLEGYAWSPNLGWLRFGSDLTGPTGKGDNWGAKLVGNRLAGWARFCSIYVSGCSGATKDIGGTELGGWDGWLKMSDVNYDTATGGFSGFAWGSLNVGWLKLGLHTEVPTVCPVDLVGDCCPAWQACGGGGGGGFSVSCSVAPAQASTGTDVTWTASASGGVTPYNYVWSQVSTGNPFQNSNPQITNNANSVVNQFTASYNSAGTYIAKVRVSDSGSNSQEVVCSSGSRDGVVITADCVQPGQIINSDTEECCDNSEPVGQGDGTYICPVSIEACTFSLASSPAIIKVSYDTRDYSCSTRPGTIPVSVSLSSCSSLSLSFPGVPSWLNMKCYQLQGSTLVSVDCSSLSGRDLTGLRIGACADRGEIQGLTDSCVNVQISDGTRSENKPVCFSGSISN